MKISSYLRNRALQRAFEQFLAEKTTAKMPNLQRINSVLIILDENDKSIHKNIESSVKALFGVGRCGFIILCNQMSDTILQSDLYNEITPKDFGFMSVLKPEKHESESVFSRAKTSKYTIWSSRTREAPTRCQTSMSCTIT